MAPRRSARKPTTTTPRNQATAPGRAAQANTPGRTTALESTPLPDVEAEQSFAYGAANTKALPQQLIAQKRMTIQQIADTLDAGISQAERNFQAQREEAEQYGLAASAADARAMRAQRRSSSRDSRASSVESMQTPVPNQGHRDEKARNRLRGIREERTSQEAAESIAEAETPEEASSPIASASLADSPLASESQHLFDDTPLPRPPRPPSRRLSAGEQSSMPPIDRFDQTYNRERDVHVHAVANLRTPLWVKLLGPVAEVRRVLVESWHRTSPSFRIHTTNNFVYHFYKISWGFMIVCAVFLFGLLASRVTCDWYGETSWSYAPVRPWHHRLNNFCRLSSDDAFLSGNGSVANMAYTRAAVAQVHRLAKEMKEHKQLVSELHSKQSVASTGLDELNARASDLAKQNANLQRGLKDAKASQAAGLSSAYQGQHLSAASFPLFKRINYASPGLGAIIDPYLSSPTKEKHFPFYQRLLLGGAGLKKFQSRPPIEALRSYTDVGDCWCAAAVTPSPDPLQSSSSSPPSSSSSGTTNVQNMDGKQGRYVQLAIILGTDIFPDEIAIDHLPLDTTPSPGSAPKDMEVWGDFSHLSPSQFAQLTAPSGPDSPPPLLQRSERRPPHHQLGLLGSFTYDAPGANRNDGRYIQFFALNVNQDRKDELWVGKVVLRINTNWGGRNTCIYRVRVHGAPTRPHASVVREEGSGEETW